MAFPKQNTCNCGSLDHLTPFWQDNRQRMQSASLALTTFLPNHQRFARKISNISKTEGGGGGCSLSAPLGPLVSVTYYPTGHYRNVRGLGKSMVVFRLFKKLRYSNERSTIFQSLYLEQKYLEEENGKMVALQILPKIKSLYGLLGRQAKQL